MARVPYSPVPERAAAMTEVPEIQRESGAAARALGSLGQSVENLGQGVGNLGAAFATNELARAGLEDELIANDANTDAMKVISGLYSDYQKKQGRSAQEGLPEFQGQLDKVYEDFVNKMPNLQARTTLAQALRYTTRSYLGYARSHADSEFSKWQSASADNAREEMTSQALTAVNNPDQIEVFANGAADQDRKLAEQQGWDPELADAKANETRSGVLSRVITSAFTNDPAYAKTLFDRFGDQLTSGDKLVIQGRFSQFDEDLKAEKMASEIATGSAADLIRHEEGFVPSTIWDVNHFRVGYSSDTITTAEGKIVPVTEGMTTTPEDAERDLARRIGDLNRTIPASVGADVWNALPEGARAAIISVGYNYGTPPNSVIAAARTGDPVQIADAISKLGANPERRQREAQIALGGLIPQADAIDQVLQRTKDNPNLQSSVLTFLNRKYAIESARVADFNRQFELDQKLRQKASEDATLAVIPYLFPELSGKTPPPNLAEVVSNSTVFTPERQLQLIGIMNRQESGQPMAAKSHKNVIEFIQRLSLPEGDPNKLTDLGPIIDAEANGDFTNADFNFLVKQWQDLKTPDGQRLQTVKGDFLQGMKASITKANPMLGVLDPSGDQQFYNFQYYVNEQVAKARSEGKDPYRLFDPNNPDYIGSSSALAPFQKSLEQSSSDVAHKFAPAASSPVTPIGEPPPVSSLPFAGGKGGLVRRPPVPAAQQPAAPATPPSVSPRLPDETPEQYLQRTSTPDQDQKLVDDYRQSLVNMGIAPDQIEQKIEEYRKTLQGHSEIDPQTFNSLSFDAKLALMERALG